MSLTARTVSYFVGSFFFFAFCRRVDFPRQNDKNLKWHSAQSYFYAMRVDFGNSLHSTITRCECGAAHAERIWAQQQ